MTILDINESVYNLTQAYPELIEILADIGFTEIKNPLVRQTIGRQMTLPRGAKMKGISWLQVVETLKKSGFLLKMTSSTVSEERVQQLKELLQSLHNGENLETVRERFRNQFKDVAIDEIMAAEKALMDGGVPAKEVQKLCDLHAALFKDQQAYDCHIISPEFEASHPLKFFEEEVSQIERVLDQISEILHTKNLEDSNRIDLLCENLAQIPIHYAKKGDLIYPLLNYKYGIIGPAKVMWAKDVELRQALHRLLRDIKVDRKAFFNNELFNNLREMCQKEKAFLLPLCAKQLSNEDWEQIYEDLKSYEICFGVEQKPWKLKNMDNSDNSVLAESPQSDMLEQEQLLSEYSNLVQGTDERIDLGYGSLTREELIAMLNAIPQEITFVDANDINRYFNDTPGFKHFKRPKQALGRDVYSCHPPQAEAVVRKMIAAFKSGEKDLFVREVNKGPIHLVVEYRAVRNERGEYLGVLELVREENEEATE